MTPYEIIVSCIAATNLGLTLVVWRTSRSKANEARLKELEDAMQSRLGAHDERLARAEEAARRSPTHDDLSKIYAEVNKTSQQLNHMAGTLQQMGENLRLLLAQQVRG